MKENSLEIKEYNSGGRLFYYKNSAGYEQWWKYDDYGNPIHWKNSDGNEVWYCKP